MFINVDFDILKYIIFLIYQHHFIFSVQH